MQDPKTYIFHFKNNCEDPSTWKECSIYPNCVLDAHYPHYTARPIYPDFLRVQFHGTSVPMEIFARREVGEPGIPVIFTMRAPTSSALQKLVNLVQQWLTRTPEDKAIMQQVYALPENGTLLIKALRMKLGSFLNKAIPLKFSNGLEVIKKHEHNIKRILKKNSESPKAWTFQARLKDMKYKCVLATYKYLVIGTAYDHLTSFCKFFETVEKFKGKMVASEVMMTAVWYCFELFTPHLAPKVLDAMSVWNRMPWFDAEGRKIYAEKYESTFKRIGSNLRPRRSGPFVMTQDINESEDTGQDYGNTRNRRETEPLGQIHELMIESRMYAEEHHVINSSSLDDEKNDMNSASPDVEKNDINSGSMDAEKNDMNSGSMDAEGSDMNSSPPLADSNVQQDEDYEEDDELDHEEDDELDDLLHDGEDHEESGGEDLEEDYRADDIERMTVELESYDPNMKIDEDDTPVTSRNAERKKHRKWAVKRKRIAVIKKKMDANVMLGLPMDVPCCGDRRKFSVDRIRGFVKLAHVIVKQKNLQHSKDIEHALCRTKHGDTDVESLVYVWNTIRSVLRKRMRQDNKDILFGDGQRGRARRGRRFRKRKKAFPND